MSGGLRFDCQHIIVTSNSMGALCSQILIVFINYQLVFDCVLLKPTGETLSGQMAEISIHNPGS